MDCRGKASQCRLGSCHNHMNTHLNRLLTHLTGMCQVGGAGRGAARHAWCGVGAGCVCLPRILGASRQGGRKGRGRAPGQDTYCEVLWDIFMLVCGRSRLLEFLFFIISQTSLMQAKIGAGRREGSRKHR